MQEYNDMSIDGTGISDEIASRNEVKNIIQLFKNNKSRASKNDVSAYMLKIGAQ